MNCNELDNYLHEFLDNELAADKRTEVANHLASCRHCAVRVAEFEQADRQLRAVKAVAPPADFLQQVRRKIEAEEKVTERASVRPGIEPPESFWESLVGRFTLPFWVKVPLAAAAALVLVFVLFNTTQPRQTPIPATYQLTKNEVVKTEEFKGARVSQQVASSGEKLKEVTRDAKSATVGDTVDQQTDFVHAEPKPEPSPIMGEELPKQENARLAQPVPAESVAMLPGEARGADTPAAPAKAAPQSVDGTIAGTAGGKDYGLADKKLSNRPVATKAPADQLAKTETTNTAPVSLAMAAAPPPVPSTPPARAKAVKAAREGCRLIRKSGPGLRHQSIGGKTIRSADLSTQTFYLEFGKASVGGAFVRGRLDEKSKFVVTSSQVEGQVIELDERAAGSRGTYGWLTLSSREFVPARPGLKPSYPYIEGYQDRQGEFHPTSRRIYQAGNQAP